VLVTLVTFGLGSKRTRKRRRKDRVNHHPSLLLRSSLGAGHARSSMLWARLNGPQHDIFPPVQRGLVSRFMGIVCGLVAGASVLCFSPAIATAQESAARAEATDLVYEAADALDQARAEFDAGRQAEGERLLGQAEKNLDLAEDRDPTTPRLGFERARLHRLDGDPEEAETVLTAWMASDLPFGEHVRSVDLLNDIRGDLSLPTVGVEWRRAQDLRNAGIGVLAGGLVASLVGVGIGFGTFAQEAYSGVTDQGVGGNRFGWGLSFVGAGVAVGGGAMTLAGQLKVIRLRRVLPGPWRLTRAGPPGLETSQGIRQTGEGGWLLEVGFAFGEPLR